MSNPCRHRLTIITNPIIILTIRRIVCSRRCHYLSRGEAAEVGMAEVGTAEAVGIIDTV